MKTLLIIKPGFARRLPVLRATIEALEKNSLEVKAIRYHAITQEEAERFYAVHRGKEFYERLIQYMSSGLSIMMEVSSEDPRVDVVSKVREIIGNTDPEKAEDGTLRKRFGKDITKNGFHASDSRKTAQRELTFFF